MTALRPDTSPPLVSMPILLCATNRSGMKCPSPQFGLAEDEDSTERDLIGSSTGEVLRKELLGCVWRFHIRAGLGVSVAFRKYTELLQYFEDQGNDDDGST